MKRTMILLFSAVAVFWNVENFFDYRSPSANEYWNRSRMMTKARAIAKVILSLADSTGTPPDYVALAEVDNDYVLRHLTRETPLRHYGYRYVHYDSRDPRGIDCALLYRGPAPRSRVVPLIMDGDTLRTRDILICEFDSLTLIVCHLPSKRGGSSEATRRRIRALQTIDSLSTTISGPLVVMGDFNDTRNIVSDSLLCHLHEASAHSRIQTGPQDPCGTIKFEGQWEQIDRCLTKDMDCTMEICNLAILTTQDKTYGGVKPLRTFSGPKYLGGVSDHYPFITRLDTKIATMSTGTTQRMRR